LEELIQKKGFLKEHLAMEYYGQLLNAFETLIKEKILHRDLKPSNILLHDGVIKIADFGFCKTLTGAMVCNQHHINLNLGLNSDNGRVTYLHGA